MNLITSASKTEQLAAFLRKEIMEWNSESEGKILSSRALAKKFNTSQMVARKAFERLANEGLLESRHGSGTYIKKKTATVKSVAILNEADISHPDTSYFYTRTIQQLRLFFEKKKIPVKLYLGYQLPGELPLKGTHASDRFLEHIKQGVISGIIPLAGFSTDEWKKTLIDSHLPIVGADPVFPNGIDFDMNEFIKKGIDILLKKGCKAPWIITNSKSRFDLFVSVLKEKGILIAPEMFSFNAVSGYIPKHLGYTSIMEIFAPHSMKKPDGLLFTDDIIFKDAVMGILELGLKVPSELKIVTHANKGSGIFIPFPVTLFEYGPDAIAEKYGNMLVSMLDGKNLTPGRVTMRFEIVNHSAKMQP
jgi:DNA-binding LacI/PurR family transcriptional regulator